MTEDNLALITDDRWSLVVPLLPRPRGRPSSRRRAERVTFTAVVHVITTGITWRDIPQEFGISPTTAKNWFMAYTSMNVWRRLVDAAIGTPHSQWARTLATAARYRATHCTRGYMKHGGAEPIPEPTAADFAHARQAMNRHHD